MTKKPTTADDYEVGYKKPPKAHQFKLGKSGNPKGRPKGANGFKTILQSELAERVTVTENGRKRTLNKLEVAVKQMVAKAAKGDARASERLFEYVLRLADPDDAQKAVSEPVSSDDAAIVERMMKRKLRDVNDDNHSV